jgi:hypothetical protein
MLTCYREVVEIMALEGTMKQSSKDLPPWSDGTGGISKNHVAA